MKKEMAIALIMGLLTACSESEPTETVESLAANPERLKALREQCRTERARVGEVLCSRAAEASTRRFFNDGKVPYTPPKEPPKF